MTAIISNRHHHNFSELNGLCPCGLTHQQYCKQRVSHNCPRAKNRHTEIECPLCNMMLFAPNPDYPQYDCFNCGFQMPSLLTLKGFDLIGWLGTLGNSEKVYNGLMTLKVDPLKKNG